MKFEPSLAENRTPGGLILRSALKQVDEIAKAIPAGRHSISVIGIDRNGLSVGFAKKSRTGNWVIESQLRVAVLNGKPGDFTFLTTILF